jgi:transposase
VDTLLNGEDIEAMPKKGPYDAQFRANAVELSNLPGKTVVGVARDLGISAETLRSWRRRSGQDQPVPTTDIPPGPDLPPEVAAELRELRARVREQDKQLRIKEQEVEILSKATAWFAGRNPSDSI